jgi:hypothetical protein
MITILGISFEQSELLLLIAPTLFLLLFSMRHLKLNKRRFLLILLRASTIIILVGALAMPFALQERSILKETTSVLVINDMSDSMQLFSQGLGTTVVKELKTSLSELSEVNSRNITTGNMTSIGNSIYENIVMASSENNVIVLISDGNHNYGRDPLDVAAFASEANTKILAMAPEIEGSEVYISALSGAKETPAKTEYAGQVAVRKMGETASYRLSVDIDGTPVLDEQATQDAEEKTFTFSHVFSVEGAHNITVRITPTTPDVFKENNVFYKSVEAVEMPKLLLVTNTSFSPLATVITDLYDVTVSPSLGDIEDYSAVIIDDQPASRFEDTAGLRDFLNDGGGLFVVGGLNSFGEGGYYGSSLEGLLPARSTELPTKKGKQLAFVIVLDISGSSGVKLQGSTKIDVEKAIAVKMIRELSANAYIGVVAFNTEAFVLSSLKKGDNETGILEDKISRLTFGGGTYAFAGLSKAREMLKNFQGSKYIVLISDGVTYYPNQAYLEAERAAADNMLIHTVGVGFDTDESFMKVIAQVGNGVYYAPTETQRIKLLLKSEEDKEEEGAFKLLVLDKNHFITEGSEVDNVSIRDFNEVTAKSNSQVLVGTQALKPILAVWRFGLGRVATLTVDDGLNWGNNLYGGDASKLISSTINWVVGNMDRKKQTRIDCEDISLGETAAVIVISKSGQKPEMTMDGAPVDLNRLDQQSFYYNLLPGRTGFLKLKTPTDTCSVAVNYPQEYGEFGTNKDLLSGIARTTGGGYYEPSEIGKLAMDARDFTVKKSTGTETERQNLQAYFTLLALLLFFIDIVIRRVHEIRESRGK